MQILHSRRIMLPSQAVIILCKYLLSVVLCLSGIGTKNVGHHPTSLSQGTGKPDCKDYETTSPRIYVNRRTPSCTMCEVSSFRLTRQKRNASFPIK